MAKPEYYEGPQAKERFEKLATQLFRAPKIAVQPTAKAAVSKPENPAKS